MFLQLVLFVLLKQKGVEVVTNLKNKFQQSVAYKRLT